MKCNGIGFDDCYNFAGPASGLCSSCKSKWGTDLLKQARQAIGHGKDGDKENRKRVGEAIDKYFAAIKADEVMQKEIDESAKKMERQRKLDEEAGRKLREGKL
jgi:hypothetical protein